ncbi:AI-2E family transporter [Demetria terragena]|uniref:AI-2E family transporter n=1 Tax=Demetria terragena TaxID=63959 RepID=UPI00036923B2|nr:AI-2E family transporter [Demetria terragena]
MTEPSPTTRDPRLEVTFGVRVAAWWSACFIAIAAAIFLLVTILSKVSLVTITVSTAVMMAALLQPAVAWLVSHKVPRALAAVLVFFLGVGGVTALGWFVATRVAESAPDMTGQLNEAAVSIRDWLVHGPLSLKAEDAEQYTTGLGETLSDGNLTTGLMETATGAIGVLSGVVFTLFALLFLLFDSGQIWRGFVGLVPPHAQPHTYEAGRAAWRTLTRYMRALVVLAAINALAMVPVMIVADLPMIVPLTILLFLGSLVPLIGILVAGAIVALIALVSQGLATAVLVIVALILVVQLFGNLLNPVLLGKAVDIHPLAILVGVTAGTILGGVFGAFIAVPLVAVIKNASLAVRDHHRGEVLEFDDGDEAAEAIST